MQSSHVVGKTPVLPTLTMVGRQPQPPGHTSLPWGLPLCLDIEQASSRLGDALGAFDGNVPNEVNTFVGRSSELARLTAMLSNVRLLTLAGPGGGAATLPTHHGEIDLHPGALHDHAGLRRQCVHQ